MPRSRIRPLAVLLLLLAAGCSVGAYQAFRPHEISEYDTMLDPVQGASWNWVRARAVGTPLGDGKEAEVVLSTLQGGSTVEPEPFSRAVLLVTRRKKDAREPTLLFRTTLFDRYAPDGAVPAGIPEKPVGVHLQLADMDGSGKELIFVGFRGEPDANGVGATWHAAYRIGEDGPEPVFRAHLRQNDIHLILRDLDKDGVHEILLPEALPDLTAAAPKDVLEHPAWLRIYRREKDGAYSEADNRYGEAYATLLLNWYEQYALALQQELPPRTLARYEARLGLIHSFRGEGALARQYLQRALDRGLDAPLRDRARTAVRGLEVTEGTAPASTSPELLRPASARR